jgi:hypothetical protein
VDPDGEAAPTGASRGGRDAVAAISRLAGGDRPMTADNKVTVRTGPGEITVSWDDFGRFSVTPHWLGDITLDTDGLLQLRDAIDSALDAAAGESQQRQRRASL